MPKKQCKVSPEVMERLCGDDAPSNPEDIILDVLRDLEPEFDALERVSPPEYSIPKQQTEEILNSYGERVGDSRLNLAWLNYGPSSR